MREMIANGLRSVLRDSRAANDRGVALIVVALGLTAFLGVAALALDMGMLYTARTESQRVSDGAALAGASQFLENPNAANLDALIRQEAVLYASMNNVHGDPVALDPTADIQVWLEDDSVKVTVRHTVARGNPIATYFARILGFDQGEVVTDATAWAAPTSHTSVTCPLPVAMADKWYQDPSGTAAWEPELGDSYCAPGEECHDPTIHSYTSEDVGYEFIIKPSQGGTSQGSGNEDEGAHFEPGWWYLWLPDGCAGARDVMDFILSCDVDCGFSVSEGDVLTDQNGNAQAVERAFEELIAMDEGATWDTNCTSGRDCVIGCASEFEDEHGHCTNSPRIRAVPLFDPRTYVKQGSGDNFVTSNLVYLFIDHVDDGPPGKRNVYARFAGGAGIGQGVSEETTRQVRVLRLVE